MDILSATYGACIGAGIAFVIAYVLIAAARR